MVRTLWIAGLLFIAGCFHVVSPRERPALAPPGEPFSHAAFGDVLARFVDDRGRIDYARLARDRGDLDRYTAALAVESPDSHPDRFPDRPAELAYWINAYNALAITAVIDRPGLERVIDQKVDFFFWTRYPLGGTNTSLYHLENGIVRKRYGDPRIHFALNCQSAGCPALPRHPFPAQGLDAALDAASRAFASDPHKVRVEGRTLELSQIFQWYASDFDEAGGAEAFVRSYRQELPPTDEVSYIPYDWTLIAQPGRGP